MGKQGPRNSECGFLTPLEGPVFMPLIIAGYYNEDAGIRPTAD